MCWSRTKSLVFLLVTLFETGCETVVEVPPPPHDSQLVAQSFFSPDSVWAIRITNTVPYASREAPAYENNATVEIWEDDRLIATPAWTDSETYVTNGQGPIPGHRYTLRVSAPGYPSSEGSDELPMPPQITSLNETTVSPTNSPSRRQITHVDLTLEDLPGQSNYYGLFIVQVRWSEDRRSGQTRLLPPTLFTFQSNDPVLGDSDFDFLNTEKTLYHEAFFTDGLFEGSSYTINFDVQYDRPRPHAEIVIRRMLAIVLLSVSEDFYLYWKSASRQAFTNDNPFAEPLRVHSNMSSGFGVFAGFQYRILPLGVSDVNVGGYTLDDLCRFTGGRLPVCLAPPPVP